MHFTRRCGPGTFSHMRDTQGKTVNFCVGEDSCSSKTVKEDSESICLVATLRSPFVSTDQALKLCLQ